MVIMISGASGGIGKATAELLAKKGYTVYGLSRKPAEIEGCKHICCDVTDPASCEAAAKEVFEKEGRIDVVINNAGMGISGAFETTEAADVKRIFDVNLFGMVNLTRAAIPYLKKTKGKIISTSSVGGVCPLAFQSFYSATKVGVDALTYCLRMELKPFGVTATAVLPGDIKTGFTAARKKNVSEPADYNGRIKRSIEKQEKSEINGMPASAVAKVMAKAVKAKNPKPRYTVGFSYQLAAWASERVPKRFREWILYNIYAK